MGNERYELTEEEIQEVNRVCGGTRIRSLLAAQVEKALRVMRQEAEEAARTKEVEA
jgi:hypothetical protein